MCDSLAAPSLEDALARIDSGLDYLNSFDLASCPAATQARVLRALERAESRHTAARARALRAFCARGGPEADGQQSARVWLKWQTQVTPGAAAGAVAWVRRLADHPAIGEALSAGDISSSWARQVCAWTDQLPAGWRDDADQILLEAAGGGARLTDLAGLAAEMHERSRRDRRDDDSGDGFDDRWLRLGITFRGAGHAEGDLTPECAAALSAVLEALSKKAGPEDARTAAQRRHDALAEACRRLIAAGLLPGRAGQPTQLQVHVSLAELRAMPGADTVERAWIAAAAGQAGWLSGAAAERAACDAAVIPVVTGHVDCAALDRLVDAFCSAHGLPGLSQPDQGQPDGGEPDGGEPDGGVPGAGARGGARDLPGAPLSPSARGQLRRELLALAVDVLSGPGGLAAALRASLGGPLASVSLPLDIGAGTPAIPAHLRRAVAVRHPGCVFPGCDQPASVCDVHHIVHRADGGSTALGNLAPLCEFHHLVVIHRWGWSLDLRPDGTATATSPDGRVLSSHGPPGRAA